MKILEVSYWVKFYNVPFFKKFAYVANKLLGAVIPVTIKMGKNIIFAHNAIGSVIHGKTIIKDNVILFQNITIGKSEIFEDHENSKVNGFILEEGCAICAGAKVLCKNGTLIIGKKSIVAANAVLLNSIGPYEIWGGIPAKRISYNFKAMAEDGINKN